MLTLYICNLMVVMASSCLTWKRPNEANVQTAISEHVQILFAQDLVRSQVVKRCIKKLPLCEQDAMLSIKKRVNAMHI